MSSALPFLGLPLLAQLEIMKQLSFSELLSLSLTSKRSRTVIRELNYGISSLEWYLSGGSTFSIIIREGTHQFVIRITSKDSKSRRKGASRRQVVPLNGRSVPMSIGNESLSIVDRSLSREDKWQVAEQLTEVIFRSFRTRETTFKLWSNGRFDVVDLFVWRYARTFETVTLLPRATMDDNDVRFVFEELRVKQFKVAGRLECGFKYPGPLTMDILEVYSESDGDWMSQEALLNVACRWIKMPYSYVPKGMLNGMIKEWLRGGLVNLQRFEAKTDKEIDKETDKEGGDLIRYDELLAGIETFPFDELDRPHYWRHRKMTGSKYVDIRRFDAKIATVGIGEEFTFTVWNDNDYAEIWYD